MHKQTDIHKHNTFAVSNSGPPGQVLVEQHKTAVKRQVPHQVLQSGDDPCTLAMLTLARVSCADDDDVALALRYDVHHLLQSPLTVAVHRQLPGAVVAGPVPPMQHRAQ